MAVFLKGEFDLNKVLSNKKALALFTLPAILLFSGLAVLPIIWSLFYSFFTGMPGVNFKFSGIDNFVKLFSDKQLIESFIRNFKYVAGVMTGQVSIGFILAMLINYCVKKQKNLVRTCLFVPVVLPSVAVGQLFQKIYAIVPQNGLLNAFLEIVGLEFLVKAWIGDVSTAIWSLAAMDIWKGIGLYCLIFYSAIIDLPGDVVEAARIDGASSLRIIRSVQIPLLKPIFRMSLIFSLTGCIKVYDSVLALTKGGPGTATYMPTMLMYDQSFQYGNFGYGSTIALLILIECTLLTFIINKLLGKKE